MGLATETRTALPFTDPGALPSTIQFVGNGRLVHAPHSRGMHDSRICVASAGERGTYRGNANPLLSRTPCGNARAAHFNLAPSGRGRTSDRATDHSTVPSRVPAGGSACLLLDSYLLGTWIIFVQGRGNARWGFVNFSFERKMDNAMISKNFSWKYLSSVN